MKLLYVVGTIAVVTYLSPLQDGTNYVQVVSADYIDNNQCELVAKITNTIDYFGEYWQTELRNQVAAVGGNTLVVSKVTNYVVTKSGFGQAYHCQFIANAHRQGATSSP